MYLVSGCPRSGTSVMMLCLRSALGEDRIIGAKFPQERGMPEQGDGESDEHYQMRKYLWNKIGRTNEEELEKSKDMNPAGFWECPWTVQGLRYLWRMREYLQNDDQSQVAKVVSQGLPGSNPDYIDKVVFMVRDPREVAKSQERLRRGGIVRVQGQRRRLDEDLVVRTPTMFTRVTQQAAAFFTEYDVPYKLVQFSNLLENPDDTMADVVDFLGEGDAEAGASEVEPKLHRSTDQSDVGGKWDEADRVYELLKEGRWEEILEVETSETRREDRRYHCPRAGRTVGIRQCVLCYGGDTVTSNMKQRAEQQGIDWQNEPCPFECGMCPEDDNPKSVEDSIKQNFWEDNTDLSKQDQRRQKGEITRALENMEQEEADDRLEAMVSQHGLPPEIAVEISDSLEEEHE